MAAVPEATRGGGLIDRWVGDLYMQTDPQGAYLTQLNFGEAALLVSHFRNAANTRRGGVFVPLPNFGNGEAFGAYGVTAKHGYSRDEIWDRTDNGKDPGFVQYEFSANENHRRYAGLHSMVSYRVEISDYGPKLVSNIIMINNGRIALPVGPGLHFYFPKISDANGNIHIKTRMQGKDLMERDRRRNLKLENILNNAQTIGTKVTMMAFESDGWSVTMSNDRLPYAVGWTDDEAYGCIEPTYCGEVKRASDIRRRSCLLPIGEAVRFRSSVLWEQIPGMAHTAVA